MSPGARAAGRSGDPGPVRLRLQTLRLIMWEETFLLLLLRSVSAVMASQCWKGVTFSHSVVSPAVESSGILRIPGVSTLPQCVAACCDLPGYNLAWLFEGRCYILSCQQMEKCRPRQRPGADSFLAFLRRAPSQTLVLQSLVRGEAPRWRPMSQSSEAPGDLEALKDLALLNGPQQDFSDPGMLDMEYPEGSPEKVDGRPQVKTWTRSSGRDGFNQSETEDRPERRLAESTAQIRASPMGNISRGDEDGTRRLLEPPEETNITQDGTVPSSTTDSTDLDHSGTEAPTPTTAHWLSSTTMQMDQFPMPVLAKPEHMQSMITTGPTTDFRITLLSEVTTPPTTLHHLAKSMTSESPTATLPISPSPAALTTAAAKSVLKDVGSNFGPVAVVGPDRKLFLPLSSLLLDGRRSTDDHGIVSFHWDTISGPPGLRLEDEDKAVATAMGLQVGCYTFRLTVSDQQGAEDSASLTIRVEEAARPPPVAHASGSHTLTLPNNSLILRGSITNGDQTRVQYLWVRDSQSPAAGDVLYGSETRASLYLANLVEGTYLFQLRVTDAQGRSSTATATVEVRPEPGGGEEMELEMLVSVSQVSLSQRDTVVRQLAALLHVLDSDIQVRGLQRHSHLSSVLRLSVWGPSGPLSGSRIVGLLRNQLLREKSDYLLFRVLRVDTVVCLLHCSGRGQCDPVTKDCTCDPFWTENVIRRYLGDGESNCEWRVLCVILTSVLLMVLVLSASWTFICCCRRRRQTKVRKKTKYTILDNMDEQERVELRPKFSIKHRSTEHNSSLMMSESELDSDQDTTFGRDRPVHSKIQLNAHTNLNGNAFG